MPGADKSGTEFVSKARAAITIKALPRECVLVNDQVCLREDDFPGDGVGDRVMVWLFLPLLQALL